MDGERILLRRERDRGGAERKTVLVSEIGVERSEN